MTSSEPSTTQVAKDEAAEVARTAAQRGGEVGQTAGDQARRVAQETTRQARDLAKEGREQLVGQAREGQRKAAGSLHTLADQLHGMSENSEGSGLAPEVVRQASERTRAVASWLEEREPGDLLAEVRSFARRKPGLFLAGAAVAGVLAGRLTRGAVQAAKDDSQQGQQGQQFTGTTGGTYVAERAQPATYPATPPVPPPVPPAPPVGPPGSVTTAPAFPPAPEYRAPETFPGQQGPVTR
ncbi:hypothetical protein [Actinophytocola xanthii]|uniref:Uncharacterized protein n=1 Tax=Actinophytocola xanthii TaxID=1912961 RepID=A0A1Q8CG09_9PSEU|nr:hypothetical protein [Actinophytocola xanthii]OLF13331.1 hypothetical protein BU204_27840 [Actinophytocola xanthii]